jgi:hypothetical protein
MDKHVFAAAVRLNETVPLGRVEPLHCTRRHVKFSHWKKSSSRLTEYGQKKSPPMLAGGLLFWTIALTVGDASPAAGGCAYGAIGAGAS